MRCCTPLNHAAAMLKISGQSDRDLQRYLRRTHTQRFLAFVERYLLNSVVAENDNTLHKFASFTCLHNANHVVDSLIDCIVNIHSIGHLEARLFPCGCHGDGMLCHFYKETFYNDPPKDAF